LDPDGGDGRAVHRGLVGGRGDRVPSTASARDEAQGRHQQPDGSCLHAHPPARPVLALLPRSWGQGEPSWPLAESISWIACRLASKEPGEGSEKEVATIAPSMPRAGDPMMCPPVR